MGNQASRAAQQEQLNKRSVVRRSVVVMTRNAVTKRQRLDVKSLPVKVTKVSIECFPVLENKMKRTSQRISRFLVLKNRMKRMKRRISPASAASSCRQMPCGVNHQGDWMTAK
jgi:hypothetical protein